MQKNGCGEKKCKYHFGDLCFSTVAAVKKWAMPNGADAPSSVGEEDNLYEFLCQAMECHPERELFSPDLPTHFFRQARGGGATGEWAHYGWQPQWTGLGEVNVRFAYRFIFDGNPEHAIRLKILRELVSPQIDEVRAAMKPPAFVHIHHEPTFKETVQGWLDLMGMDLLDLEFMRGPEYRILMSGELAESWEVYHAHNTTLTALTEAEHHERHREMKRGH